MTSVPPTDIFTRRVCLRLDGMEDVIVRRELPYGPLDGALVMDVYYPRDQTDDGRWPAVIIVSGYPGRMGRTTSVAYKDIGWTVSMSQLIARSGLAAIAYTNRDPVPDLRALFEHLHEHGETLRIDAARIGVIAVSGNVPTALATVMKDAPRTPACAVFAYGCLLDLDDSTYVTDAAQQFGFVNPGQGRGMADVRRDIPLLITRAGRDQFPGMNASIDSFIRHGLVENLPITLVNHAEGPHAFDLFDNSRTSRAILRHTLRFLRQHLTDEGADASFPADGV